MAPRKGLAREDAETALAEFIHCSDELTDKTWREGRSAPMSSGAVAELLGATKLLARCVRLRR